ncbi:MAG: hybrid sensor histidine kinase/response regulator [Zavarzinella sp.]
MSAENPLLELFREELQAASQVLLDGIDTPPERQDTTFQNQVDQALATIIGGSKIVGFHAIADSCRLIQSHVGNWQQLFRMPEQQSLLYEVLNTLRGLADRDDDGLQIWHDQAGDWLREIENRFQVLKSTPVEPIPPISETQTSKPVPEIVAEVSPAVQIPTHAPSDFVPDTIDCQSNLFHIFQDEVALHTNQLADGILLLENEPDNGKLIEPLMRAAHSLKGAARIVNLSLAVDLSHHMEDLLVAAGARKVRLDSNAIDSLLEATDLLSSMATITPTSAVGWQMESVAKVRQLEADFAARIAGKPLPVPTAPESSAPNSAEIIPQQEVALSPPVVAPSSVSPPHVGEIRPTENEKQAPKVHIPEAAIRISSASLSRLMSLAGESLVHARWLQPFSSALNKLRLQQEILSNQLDEFFHRFSSGEQSLQLQVLGQECRNELARNRMNLGLRIREFEDHASAADDLNSRLYREVISSRMRPFGDGVHAFPRLVRDMCKKLGKLVDLEIRGHATPVDRDILEQLEAPLTHMLRNAMDHGMETPDVREEKGKSPRGRILLDAHHRAGLLQITLADDGPGIDTRKVSEKIVRQGMVTQQMAAEMTEQELLEFLFLPGFSTASAVSEYSGRGVGLDVVRDMVRKVGGTLRLSSNVGRGTTFHLQLPITLSVVRAVLVIIAGEPYAFPHNRIDRLVRLPISEVRVVEGAQYAVIDGKNIGLIPAAQILALSTPPRYPELLSVVLISDLSGQYGLVVDAFTGEQDLVVRPLDSRLGRVPNINSAAILDDGSPILIADIEDMIRSAQEALNSATTASVNIPINSHRSNVGRTRVLVIEDSVTVREVEKQMLQELDLDVSLAVDGQDGWNRLQSSDYDLVISDVDMPRMNGFEVVQLMRNDPRLKKMPVIMVSYKDRPEDRQRGADLDVDYYLTKSSFHDKSFINAVRDILRR